MKLISFTLWGNNPKYTIGAIENIKLRDEFYPEWICRFYVNESVPSDIIKKMKEYKNVQVVNMSGNGGWDESTLNRFLPISEPDVEVMISRDCDSRLNLRESLAVKEWLEGDKNFHIMIDHPFHNVLILAGMFGCKKNTIPNIKELITNYNHTTNKQNDQNFLRDIIFPKIKDSVLIHDSFFGRGKKFPSKRENYEFVGGIYNEKNIRGDEYKFIKQRV